MDLYLLMLYVTKEQDAAIQSLFIKKQWTMLKTDKSSLYPGKQHVINYSSLVDHTEPTVHIDQGSDSAMASFHTPVLKAKQQVMQKKLNCTDTKFSSTSQLLLKECSVKLEKLSPSYCNVKFKKMKFTTDKQTIVGKKKLKAKQELRFSENNENIDIGAHHTLSSNNVEMRCSPKSLKRKTTVSVQSVSTVKEIGRQFKLSPVKTAASLKKIQSEDADKDASTAIISPKKKAQQTGSDIKPTKTNTHETDNDEYIEQKLQYNDNNGEDVEDMLGLVEEESDVTVDLDDDYLPEPHNADSQLECDDHQTAQLDGNKTDKMVKSCPKKYKKVQKSEAKAASIADTDKDYTPSTVQKFKKVKKIKEVKAATATSLDNVGEASGKKVLGIRKPRKGGEKGRYECDVCKRVYTLKRRYEAHQANEGCSNRCPYCGKICAGKGKTLKAHIFYKHEKEDVKFNCEVCGRRFYSQYMVTDHMLVHKGVKSHICDICGMTFFRNSELLTHTRKHEERKTGVPCPVCHKSFTNKEYLQFHLKVTHSDKRNYMCEICGTSYKTKYTLKGHMRAVHGTASAQWKYPCNLCGKIYKYSHQVSRHKKQFHEQLLRYFCPVCNKGFYFQNTMKDHLNIHTDTRPYSCSQCDFSSCTRKQMTQHSRKHGKPSADVSASQVLPSINTQTNQPFNIISVGDDERQVELALATSSIKTIIL